MATATLANNKDFAVGTVGQDATKWKLLDGNSDAATVLWTASLSGDPDALLANQFYRITGEGEGATDTVITQARGTAGMTEEGAKEELRGLLKDGRYMALYDFHNSSDRRLTDFVAVDLADWTIADSV